jgi:hypothetical protein
MNKAKAETRSPLKDKPLRYPGQSLDEEIDRVLSEEGYMWVTVAVLGIYFAGVEWVRWAMSGQFHPVMVSITVLFVLLLAALKIMKARNKLQTLRLGRDGERAVGQYLDDLREKGYRVFHDLIGDGFNVDHVVISRHGVFTVETKTFSKPRGKEATIKVHDGVITVNVLSPDRNPLDQAKAQAKWVSTVLRESTGKSYPVKPVIVFPGWYVEPMSREGGREVWVLNPKALPTFIDNEPFVLEQQDVMLATYHLSRHIRTTN